MNKIHWCATVLYVVCI